MLYSRASIGEPWSATWHFFFFFFAGFEIPWLTYHYFWTFLQRPSGCLFPQWTQQTLETHPPELIPSLKSRFPARNQRSPQQSAVFVFSHYRVSGTEWEQKLSWFGAPWLFREESQHNFHWEFRKHIQRMGRGQAKHKRMVLQSQ